MGSKRATAPNAEGVAKLGRRLLAPAAPLGVSLIDERSARVARAPAAGVLAPLASELSVGCAAYCALRRLRAFFALALRVASFQRFKKSLRVA